MRYVYILIFLWSPCVAQPLTNVQKLATLGKIWGFLKYYHPAVASGHADWDKQLLTLFPKVRKATGAAEVSTIYTQLLDSLGKTKPCRKCLSESRVNERLARNLDLSFVNDSTVFNSDLRKRLTELKTNRNQGQNYYIQSVHDSANVAFTNEKLYAAMNVPDEAHRLLALFRYWNIVHYFFPYKYLIGSNWNDVLIELIPVFQQANNENAYQLAIYQAIVRTNDSHGTLTNTDETRCIRCDLGRYWMPFTVKLINNVAVITHIYNDSLANIHHLKVGMVIYKIDGETILDRLNKQRKYIAASNESALLRNMAQLIGAGASRQATITIAVNGRDSTLSVLRYPYSTFKPQSNQLLTSKSSVSRWLANGIGYVNMGELGIQQVDSIMKPFMTARTIIFDVRSYPQGTIAKVADYLMPHSMPFMQLMAPDLSYPGLMKLLPVGGYIGHKNPAYYKGKVIVLVDEQTQSEAEFTVMALQTAPDVTVVGSQTAGADGGYVTIPLPGGYQATMTGQGIYYPDERETQRIGIVPDVVVQATIEGIQVGRDDVLERAITIAK